jgi:hypothetical protein
MSEELEAPAGLFLIGKTLSDGDWYALSTLRLHTNILLLEGRLSEQRRALRLPSCLNSLLHLLTQGVIPKGEKMRLKGSASSRANKLRELFYPFLLHESLNPFQHIE